MKKSFLAFFSIACGGLFGAENLESAADCAEGGEPAVLEYGDHALCEINPDTDRDTFAIEGSAGERLRVVLCTRSVNLDPHIELRAPNGDVLEDRTCFGGGAVTSCDFTFDVTLPLSGVYFIAVSDSGADETGAYTLQVERIPPAAPCRLDHDTAVADRIIPGTDIDFFSFRGNSGADVRVIVTTPSPRLSIRIELLAPDGSSLEDTQCRGGGVVTRCSYSRDFSLPQDGSYLLVISGLANTSEADYEVTVQCLFPPGACAPPEPQFVRGDCDGSGRIEGGVVDGVANFRHCFAGLELPCLRACDADGDGNPCTGVTDGIQILMSVFRGGTLPPPFPECGSSESPLDLAISCEMSGC